MPSLHQENKTNIWDPQSEHVECNMIT